MAYIRDEKRWAGSPLLAGILRVSLILNLYLFTIILLHDIIFKISFISDTREEILMLVVILTETIVAIVNYFIYGYKKKYLKIIDRYKQEDEKTRKKNRLIVTLLIIFSLLVMAVLFIVSVQLYKQRHGIIGHF